LTPNAAGVALSFALYFVAVLLIGWVAYRRTATIADFVLGGRRLGSGVAALSAGASDMSGWLLLGLPGLAYASGLSSLWLAGGLLLGTWLNWRLMAARVRVFTEHYGDALTLPEYLANRFDDRRGWLRGIAAVFILLFFLIYTASGLVAGGKLFETAFGLPYVWAVAAGTLAIILYTAIGGFLAVSWTDVLQGLLMAAALVAVPLIAVVQLGGVSPALAGVAEVNGDLLDPFMAEAGVPMTLMAAISLAAWGLGYFGQPHILARFQGIRSARAVAPARRIAVAWVALTLAGATLTGLVGIPLLDPPLVGDERERVFMDLVGILFHPLIAGLCLAAILAAVMSTADSQLLVSSAAFTEDFYRRLIRPGAGPRELVLAGRLSVLVLAALALVLALDPEAMVLDLVSYAWAGFGAAFGPVLILSVYWRRMTWGGALAGVLAGGSTVVGWKQLSGGIFDLYELAPGFILAWVAAWVVSRIGSAPGGESGAAFDRALGRLRKDAADPAL
jgi:sodium/proline symporter